MKTFYENKIKKIKTKIAFLESMIVDEKNELAKYEGWLKEELTKEENNEK